jgi:hypothetical protein
MSLVHIYSCCPSALKLNRITHFFGPNKGRFLDPFPFKGNLNKKTWLKHDLTQDELKLLKELIVKLENSGCIKKTLPDEFYGGEDKLKSLLLELNKKSSPITLGIVGNKKDLPDEVCKVFTVKDFENEGKYEHEPVQLSQSPTAFFEFVPSFIITKSKRFKLVDPYIYEVVDELSTEKRLEFIYQIIKRFYSTKKNEGQKIYIDVYGRVPSDYNASTVKQHIANFKKISQNKLPFEINFYVMKKKKILDNISLDIKKFAGKKIHERFFSADTYNFSFEDSSEDRTALDVTQTWRFENSKEYLKFIECYNNNSEIFDIVDHFDIKQLEVLSRN